MNKNLKEVNVRREYNGQVWYEAHRVEPTWTPEFLEQWVKDRRAGVQYNTGYGTVHCREALPSLSLEEINARAL